MPRYAVRLWKNAYEVACELASELDMTLSELISKLILKYARQVNAELLAETLTGSKPLLKRISDIEKELAEAMRRIYQLEKDLEALRQEVKRSGVI